MLGRGGSLVAAGSGLFISIQTSESRSTNLILLLIRACKITQLKPNIQTESIHVGDRHVKDIAGDQELAPDINLSESTCHDVL